MPASDLRGELILEEPQYNRKLKQNRYYQYAVGIIVPGVMLAVLSVYMRFFMSGVMDPDGELCLAPLMLLAASGSFICFLFSFYFYMLGKKGMGVKVYENGISYPSNVGFREIFYPFAEFKGFVKQEHFLYGSVYIFELPRAKSLMIRQKTIDLDDVREIIEDRIQRPREVTEVDLVSERRSFRRTEAIWYISVAGLALLLAGIISFFALSGFDLLSFVMLLGYLAPIMINSALFIVVLRFIYELRSKSWGFGINLRLVASVYGVSLLIFLSAIYGSTLVGDTLNNPDIVTNDYPGESVLNGTYYEGEYLLLEGDISLLTGNLTLKDCEVVFNCSEHKEFGIWTGRGTNLVLENTIVRPLDKDATYTFELHGSARFTGCEFYNIWGNTDTDHLNGDGGLKIHNDDVVIEDSLISDCRSNGILIDHVSPRIINCTIEKCHDDGIEIHGGEAYIYGNWIKNNEWGICAFGDCEATISSNAFVENKYGLSTMGSKLTVTDNHFVDHKTAALFGDHSESVMRNNEYVGKKTDPGSELMLQDLAQVCLVMFFISSAVSFLILYITNRRMLGGPPRKKK
jgi:hypothetical protein